MKKQFIVIGLSLTRLGMKPGAYLRGEYLFGQCASGPVIMCEYGDWLCASRNVRVNKEWVSASTVMCE